MCNHIRDFQCTLTYSRAVLVLMNRIHVTRSIRYFHHISCRLRSISKAEPGLSDKVQSILKSEGPDALKNDGINVLSDYISNRSATSAERGRIIKFMYSRKAHEDLIKLSNSCLLDSGEKFQSNVSADEMRSYMNSLVFTRQHELLNRKMLNLINQFSLTRKDLVVKVINSVFTQLYRTTSMEQSLTVWVKLCKYMHGHVDFTSYEHYKYILKTLLFFLREKDISACYKEVLDLVELRENPLSSSQFASTLMYLLTYSRNFLLAEKVWDYKIEKGFPVVASDLTSICKTYCHFRRYSLVTEVYSRYPEAHDDQSQFDYLLVAYAKQQNWESLQNQFNSLFGIGELPNINHYGIVMYAIAQLGERDIVERLYSQLLRRKMVPNLPVLQSLLYAYYKSGDIAGCFRQFELFNKYGIQPTSSTCQIMLKVYRNIGDIDGALRTLKRMTDSNIEIWETHFAILINTCAKITNYAIAEELFQVMKDYYNIKPTGSSIGALMYVYIESNLPQQALKLFHKYCKGNSNVDENIKIYNKAIEAHMLMGQDTLSERLFQEILDRNIPTNSEFYKVMIAHLSRRKKDYDTAEGVLDQLLNHPTLVATASHFEILMDVYDRCSYREGVFKLYQRMLDHNIPVNSRVLYYLIKSTFKVKLQTKENLDEAIDVVDDIMKRAAKRTLDITFDKLHPSVMAWPMRAISKFYSPMKAIDLMNKYNDLFYENGESANGRLVVMRSMMVLSAEIQQWDDFQKIFERYLSKIDYYDSLPSSTVRNKKLSSSLRGILGYKIKQLAATNSVTKIPDLLKQMESKGLIIDNDSWNEAVLTMFSDSRTIEEGLRITNEKLIHGYNLIHKMRLLKKHATASTSIGKAPWLLDRKKENPKSFNPSLFLKSEVYEKVKTSLDSYLSTFVKVEEEIGRLVNLYGYFMKSYLMEPRSHVPHWDEIEYKNASFFRELRTKKRITAWNCLSD